MAPHRVLREAGCKFDLDKADFATMKTVNGEHFRKIHAK